jgi:transposase InsO family protein
MSPPSPSGTPSRRLGSRGHLVISERECEDTYNTIRPHQALDHLTPQEYLDKHQEAA